jgi:hypothetical protein
MNAVYVVEMRRKGPRPDYNAFGWKPLIPKLGQRQAQALVRDYRANDPKHDYRVMKYVASAK